jgi:hypothetical protein
MNDTQIDIQATLARARFVHLDDDEIAGWLGRRLDYLSGARVEAHLALCLLCESRVRRARPTSIGVSIPALGLAAKAKSRPRYKGQSDDGVLRYVVARGPDLTVTVSLSSSDLGLANRVITLSGERFSRRLKLLRLAPDQVGADTVLTARDRQRLGASVLTIALSPKTSGTRRPQRPRRDEDN